MMMSDKPILFSAPMVRALLDGRKTQTRRVLSLRGYKRFSEFGPSDTSGYDWHFRREDACWCDFRTKDLPLPYAIEDSLWVRETWAPLRALTHNDPGGQALADNGFYRADEGTNEGEIDKWTPSIFMPRWASRLTLTVTEVRVERLQDISSADAIAEGVPAAANSSTIDCDTPDPRDDFRSLWNNITGPCAWEANPWVVAVSFTVHRCNIDKMGE